MTAPLEVRREVAAEAPVDNGERFVTWGTFEGREVLFGYSNAEATLATALQGDERVTAIRIVDRGRGGDASEAEGAKGALRHALTRGAQPSIYCIACGQRSFNANDVERRYCGECSSFL